jgi:hypothetical protein
LEDPEISGNYQPAPPSGKTDTQLDYIPASTLRSPLTPDSFSFSLTTATTRQTYSLAPNNRNPLTRKEHIDVHDLGRGARRILINGLVLMAS